MAWDDSPHLRDSLPNASFIGLTGALIEKTDANTHSDSDDYLCVCDIHRAIAD